MEDRNPRSVLFFTSQLGGGGAEKHVVRIANQLAESGFHVEIAVLRGGGSYEPEISAGIEIVALGVRTLVSPPILRRLLINRRPDVLCTVMDATNIAGLVACLGLRTRPAVVCVTQNSPVALYGRMSLVRRRAMFGLMRMLYPRADSVVAISAGIAAELSKLVPKLAGKVTVVPNAGLDDTVRTLSNGSTELHKSGPTIVACGRFVEQKGFDLLLRAFALVRQKVDAQLWLVGDGPLKTDLEREAERVDVRQAVRFTGFLENPYVVMRLADVFVLSSVWEGFGNVLVEAMSAGAPVVSTDCPYGPAEIIDDGRSGILVRSRNEEELARAILLVLEDEDLRDRLIDGGLRRANDYTAEKIAAQYVTVFEKALNH